MIHVAKPKALEDDVSNLCDARYAACRILSPDPFSVAHTPSILRRRFPAPVHGNLPPALGTRSMHVSLFMPKPHIPLGTAIDSQQAPTGHLVWPLPRGTCS